MTVVNSNSNLELENFDQWVRKRLEECNGDEDCFQFVWEQILHKLGIPSRKGPATRITERLSGFLDGAYGIVPGKFFGRKPMQDSEFRNESEVMLYKCK